MPWEEVLAYIKYDDVKHARYGEGYVDGDIEDATEAVHGLIIIIRSRDHHCEDYGDSCQEQFGDSIAGEREKEALEVRGFNRYHSFGLVFRSFFLVICNIHNPTVIE